MMSPNPMVSRIKPVGLRRTHPYRFVWGLVLLLVSLGVSPGHAQSPVVGDGQLGAPIEWIDAGLGRGLVHMGQRTTDGELHLTPNESFFPRLGLRAQGKTELPDVNGLNKGQVFDYITDWDPGEPAEWGLWLERAGSIEVGLWMSGVGGGERFMVGLVGGASQTIQLKPSKGTGSTLVAKIRIAALGEGKQVLQVEKTSDGASVARLHGITLSGPAVQDAALLRKRWRPAAAHTRFSSSRQPDGVKLWIMEMDAVPGELAFYSPVTTPFGYYGPSWLADGRVNTKFNFSLWSYGRSEPEPSIEKLSHLLAIGNPVASFDGFGHEGTGVKIRDWDPLEGRQNQRQALALRVEPGNPYDTYFSYFYAADEKRWRLFGVGNKFNKGKPLASLWVGSFVEVPGPPDRQRTGSTLRKMRYRGWVMADNNQLVPLDRMSVGDVDKSTNLTYTDRGVQPDGWFYMETGGWLFRPAPQGQYVTGDVSNAGERPAYLSPNAVKALLGVPSSIEPAAIKRRGAEATLTLNIRNASKSPEVLAYYGETDGLTFADRWTHKAQIIQPKEGANTVTLKNVPPNKSLKIRLLLKNDEGQFWSTQTYSVGE